MNMPSHASPIMLLIDEIPRIAEVTTVHCRIPCTAAAQEDPTGRRNPND
jgi:hypothetical protein